MAGAGQPLTGSKIEQRQWRGRSLLSLAAEWGRDATAKMLLKLGADINSKDEEGWTPMHYATRCHRAGVIRQLLGYPEFIHDVKDHQAKRPLLKALWHRQIRQNNSQALKLLVQAATLGFYSPAASHQDGEHWAECTPSAYAFSYGDLALLNGMLTHAGGRFAERAGCKSLLHFISEVQDKGLLQYEEKVKALLGCGKLDIYVLNSNGDSPLFYAVRLSNTVTLERLLKTKGVQPNKRNAAGDTPLLLAVRTQRAKVVELLAVSEAVDHNARDAHGMTVLHIATEYRSSHEAWSLLMAKKMDLRAVDRLGLPAIATAVRRGRLQMFQLLAGAGQLLVLRHLEALELIVRFAANAHEFHPNIDRRTILDVVNRLQEHLDSDESTRGECMNAAAISMQLGGGLSKQ